MHVASVVFCLALACLGARAALAEPAAPRDVAVIAACLKSAEASKAPPESCVSRIAKPCFKGDENAAAPGEVTQCFDREQRAWEVLLDEAFNQLRLRLDDGQQAKLGDMQRSWLATRALTCGFFADYFQGSMANPMIAACLNRETALRANFLRVFTRDAAGAK